ncbi:hypothetical protein [Sinosporangium siamense]|uniref:Uncharacterized protein n=1 Tax=Sinosporangium siamense TaxID=1367973 RepID=A0A919RKX2_9ACTN|nr:hypothetical protein [Sinosporangium siamense]GII95725.1 hypothetical protein Ssi02_59560 [Sinosporangium siamense]
MKRSTAALTTCAALLGLVLAIRPLSTTPEMTSAMERLPVEAVPVLFADNRPKVKLYVFTSTETREDPLCDSLTRHT